MRQPPESVHIGPSHRQDDSLAIDQRRNRPTSGIVSTGLYCTQCGETVTGRFCASCGSPAGRPTRIGDHLDTARQLADSVADGLGASEEESDEQVSPPTLTNVVEPSRPPVSDHLDTARQLAEAIADEIGAPKAPVPTPPTSAKIAEQIRRPQGQASHLSPDGYWRWDGAQWVPVQPVRAEAGAPTDTVSAPPANTNLIARGGRWFTPDERLWWDGNQWLPYRRVTWNSIHIYSNPPEDRATLSRNLGIWCACFGILGLFRSPLGSFSIMAAIAGPISVYYGLSFFSLDGRGGRRLSGSGKAMAGVILSLVGLSGFLLVIVVWIATR